MGSHDADLQAAVDSASVALDAHVTDEAGLVDQLRESLSERGVETDDTAWLERMAAGILGNRNYLIESEPDDFTPRRDG